MNKNFEIKRSEGIYHGLMSSRTKCTLRALANQIPPEHFNLEIVFSVSEIKRLDTITANLSVIPAQAGIHGITVVKMDPRLRGDDRGGAMDDKWGVIDDKWGVIDDKWGAGMTHGGINE